MAGWTSMRQYEPSSIPAESLKLELELYFFCPRFPLSYREPISFLDDRRLWDERMSHFSTEALLDFARGLSTSPKGGRGEPSSGRLCGDSLGKRRKLDIGDGPNPQRR